MEKNINVIFSERLEFALRMRGMKPTQLARRTGLTNADISNYRHAHYRPGSEKLHKIAKALNVAPEWLDGYDVPMEKIESNLSPVGEKTLRTISLFEYIGCGEGTFNDGTVIDTISLPSGMFKPNAEYFGIYARGDSMIGAGINNGDLLIFERTDVPIHNKIGAFCIDNEYAICKKYQSFSGKVVLLSANDNYAPIILEPTKSCFRCVGILVSIIKVV